MHMRALPHAYSHLCWDICLDWVLHKLIVFARRQSPSRRGSLAESTRRAHMRVARAHTRTKMYVLLAPLRAMIECVLTKKYVLLAPLPAMLECVRARRWFGMRWTLSWSTSLRCVRMCVCARMVVRVRVDVHGRTGQ